MVKHPPQAQAFGYRLILYRKVSSRLYMYTIFFTQKVTNRPPLLFPRVERADCPGPVIKKKKRKKELHSKSGLWSTLLLNGQRS
jgi:hypothetical protein